MTFITVIKTNTGIDHSHQNKHRDVNGTLENVSSFTNENSELLVGSDILYLSKHVMLMWGK